MHSNPFATRFTRPGACHYLPPGQSPGTIVAALRQAGWWGQIVGPHGSGKSTLVATLIPEMIGQGRRGGPFALSQGQRQLPGALAPGSWNSQTQVVIDGYEQLSWWNRRKVQSLSRRAGAGLLITTHKSCGLANLFQTAPSLPLAQSIVGQLVPADTTITADDVDQAWQEQGGNLRELLFRLYDLYQSRQS